MNALIINGSPNKNGNTFVALNEIIRVFESENIKTELINVGHVSVSGCIACSKCRELKRCVFDDVVNELAPKFETADCLIVGTPVYYASANATLIALLQRLFYSTPFDKTMKVGAGVACARRGGITATFDELNKFFAISGMPIASGQYWNGIHGASLGEANQDLEGLQMMRTLAKNAVFLIKSIALGKQKFGLPTSEPKIFTNFIR